LLIGPDGKIIKRYDDVDPDTHKDIVLNDLKAASGKTK
jgi:peroxiredoxin